MPWLGASCAGDTALLELITWLSGSGAFLSPKLALTCTAEGARAVKVVEGASLHPGEVVASVPASLMLTQRVALEDDPQLAKVPGLRGTNLIALALLRQMAPGQRWRPFVKSLPQEQDTTLFWSEAELAELQGAELASHAAARASAIARHHGALAAALSEQAPTLDEFRWALSMVWSRGHTVQLDLGGRQGALVPLADLFNHHTRPSVHASRTEGEGGSSALVLRAAGHLHAGDEATVPYGGGGALPNSQLLMDYGFCHEATQAVESVPLPLAVPFGRDVGADAMRSEALDSLGLLRGERRARELRLSSSDTSLPPLILVFASLATAPRSSLHEAVEYAPVALRPDAPPQARHWLASVAEHGRESGEALRFLRQAVRSAVRQYATNATEDEAILRAMAAQAAASGTAPGTSGRVRARCAVVVRLAEKRLLGRWDERVTASLRALGGEGEGEGQGRGGAARGGPSGAVYGQPGRRKDEL